MDVSRKQKRRTRQTRQTQQRKTRRKQHGGKTQIHRSAAFIDMLVYLREFTLDAPFELCGTITKEKIPPTRPGEQSQSEYVAYVHELTPPLNNDERPHCIYERTKDYVIWHNHPRTSKFYPSREDIVKGLKPHSRHISESYIFCEFGIWKIQYWDHTEVTEEEMKQVKRSLDTLYHQSGRGRVYNQKTDDAVSQMMRTIYTIFGSRLTIHFLGTDY